MKFSIAHDVLLNAVEKGGLSFFSGDNQADQLRDSIPTLKCLKLLVEEETIKIESSTGFSSSTFVCKDKSLEIKEAGTVCIDALRLKNSLKSIQYPHLVKIEVEGNLKEKTEDSVSILGKASFSAINEKGRESFKEYYDVYSPEDFVDVSYFDEQPCILKIPPKDFSKALDSVSFVSEEDPFSELFDHVSIFSEDGNVHVAATDNKRAALFTFKEEIDVMGVDKPLLIRTKVAKEMVKELPLDIDFVEISTSPDEDFIIFKMNSFKVRASLPPKEIRSKFPTFSKAINMETKARVSFNSIKELKQTISRLCADSIYGTFDIQKDKEIVTIKSFKSSLNGKVSCEKIDNSLDEPITLSIYFIKEILKKVSSKDSSCIKFSFSNDEKRIVIHGESTSPFYLTQKIIPFDA